MSEAHSTLPVVLVNGPGDGRVVSVSRSVSQFRLGTTRDAPTYAKSADDPTVFYFVDCTANPLPRPPRPARKAR